MSKKLIIGILIILALGIGGWVYFSQFKEAPPEEELPLEQEVSPEKELPSGHILSGRAGKFSISSGESYPVFLKELIVDPFSEVKEGEKQYYSIWTKDPEEIEKVTATIKTDKEDKVLKLQLVEGTKEEGRWEGSWLTENISLSDSYPTEFRVVNKTNKDRKLTCVWYLFK